MIVSFLRELWAFLRVRKKYWLMPVLHRHGAVRRLDRADQRLGGRALHLHAVLSALCVFSGISAFYHDSAAALVEDGRIVAAAQEERFTRKKHDAGFPEARDRLLPGRGGHAASASRPCGLLRQAVPQVRASAGNLSRLCPRGFTSFRMALPLWMREKLFQKSLLAGELKTLRAGIRLAEAAAVLRAPPEPRGLGVLSRRRSSGRGADDGRRRRMGDDRGRRSARATTSRSTRKSIFRTASACSIPPSPTTPASRSIPANTS